MAHRPPPPPSQERLYDLLAPTHAAVVASSKSLKIVGKPVKEGGEGRGVFVQGLTPRTIAQEKPAKQTAKQMAKQTAKQTAGAAGTASKGTERSVRGWLMMADRNRRALAKELKAGDKGLRRACCVTMFEVLQISDASRVGQRSVGGVQPTGSSRAASRGRRAAAGRAAGAEPGKETMLLYSSVTFVDLPGAALAPAEDAVRSKEDAYATKMQSNLSKCVDLLSQQQQREQKQNEARPASAPVVAAASSSSSSSSSSSMNKKRVVIPWRDSKLTMLLRDKIGRRNLTIMLGAVSPATSELPSSRRTLEFLRICGGLRQQPIDERAANISVVNHDELVSSFARREESEARARQRAAALAAEKQARRMKRQRGEEVIDEETGEVLSDDDDLEGGQGTDGSSLGLASLLDEPSALMEVLETVETGLSQRLKLTSAGGSASSSGHSSSGGAEWASSFEDEGSLWDDGASMTLGAGQWHSLAVRSSDGVAFSWGAGHYLPGEQWGHRHLSLLGQNQLSGPCCRVPTPIAGLADVNVKEVAAGGMHTLLLSTCGRVWSCGIGKHGALGHGDTHGTANCPAPVQIVGGGLRQARAVQIAAGDCHSLILSSAGHAYSFGWGSGGRLGHGDAKTRTAPQRIEALAEAGVLVLQVSGGDTHSLAVSESGEVYAWGRRSYGRLGLGEDELVETRSGLVAVLTTGDALLPTKVALPSGVRVKQVSAGGSHSLAVATNGALYSFGNGGNGQLGHGDTADRMVPTEVLSLRGTPVRLATAGMTHSLVLTEEANVLTFGSNEQGCLGQSNKGVNRLVPTAVAGLAGVKVEAVAAGHNHTIVRFASGEMRTFGSNDAGQLGANLAAGGNVVGSAEPLVVEVPMA